MHFAAADILEFYGRDLDSRVIEWWTCGPSHVGIVANPKPSTGIKGPLLFESTMLCDLPCALTGKKIAGVQAHAPAERIAAYNGRVRRLRLKPSWALNPWESWQLTNELSRIVGEGYDLRDALLSGTRLLKWTRLMPYPDRESVFCSMLCAQMLMRVWRLPLCNPATYSPASLIRTIRQNGTYSPPIDVSSALEVAA